VLEGSDKLARDAFVHSVKVFTSLVLFYAFIINYNITFIFSAHTSQTSTQEGKKPSCEFADDPSHCCPSSFTSSP